MVNIVDYYVSTGAVHRVVKLNGKLLGSVSQHLGRPKHLEPVEKWYTLANIDGRIVHLQPSLDLEIATETVVTAIKNYYSPSGY